MLYFGFIFFYKRRMQFLVFVGILCLGNRPVDKLNNSVGTGPLVGGILALLDAALHFAVRVQHPEFDQSMQAALGDQDDAAQAAAGLAPAAPQYAAAQEDVYQAPTAPPASYAPAPAPAPAPGPNIYGGDDGGTAI